jgi:transcriptional regulator with XRE-family HTH domain
LFWLLVVMGQACTLGLRLRRDPANLGSTIPPSGLPIRRRRRDDGAMANLSGINRPELATFLRNRRHHLQPGDVGLPDGLRRRTPGLRRQEVAQLAAISVDYYVRLEQGRGPRPSKQVLGALARALVLSADERAYLFHLAGEAAPLGAGPSRGVPATIRNLLVAMTGTPAFVMDAKYDVLAWNRLATHLIGDLDLVPEDDRNVLRWSFTAPEAETHWDRDQNIDFQRSSVADLRAATARYPGDRGIADLITELLATSSRFAALWVEHEVEVRRHVAKTIDHPLTGPFRVDCQVLHMPDTDQRLVVYVAPPGSPAEAALARLREADDAALRADARSPLPQQP